jgi:hypothetical protein
MYRDRGCLLRREATIVSSELRGTIALIHHDDEE